MGWLIPRDFPSFYCAAACGYSPLIPRLEGGAGGCCRSLISLGFFRAQKTVASTPEVWDYMFTDLLIFNKTETDWNACVRGARYVHARLNPYHLAANL